MLHPSRACTGLWADAPVDGEILRLKTGLDGRVAEILHGNVVFDLAGHGREVERAGVARGKCSPGLDEPFVDAVELVALGIDVLEPVPLGDGGLDQSGRR